MTLPILSRLPLLVKTVLFPPVDDDLPVSPDPVPDAEALVALKRRIEAAESRFSLLSDDAEITAAVYELAALEARYDVILRRMKQAAGEQKEMSVCKTKPSSFSSAPRRAS